MMRAGASVDDLLNLMRREGQSRIVSISLLMELTGMRLRDAKTAVHKSPVWEDVRSETETFQEKLEQAAQQMQKDKPKTR
jgi:ribosomal protein L7/L12